MGIARASPYTDTVAVPKNAGPRSSAMTNDARVLHDISGAIKQRPVSSSAPPRADVKDTVVTGTGRVHSDEEQQEVEDGARGIVATNPLGVASELNGDVSQKDMTSKEFA
jgi:hypothetical protein